MRLQKEHESNEVTEFYDPETSPLKVERLDAGTQAALNGFNPQGGTFTPGRF